MRSFEFTDEVAIFDLLDVGLVHAWTADPNVRVRGGGLDGSGGRGVVGMVGYNSFRPSPARPPAPTRSHTHTM